MVVGHCTDGAECATGAEVLGADYTRRRLHPEETKCLQR